MKHKSTRSSAAARAVRHAAAVALGRQGGRANTAAQNAARARNAKLGGWPKGRPRKPSTSNPNSSNS